MENFIWSDWWAEALGELLQYQDAEELGKVLGKAANTISCWTYKSKPLGIPNAEQLGKTLDFVQRTRPEAVSRFLARLAARFGAVGGSREDVLRQIAGEVKRPGAGVRGQGPGEMQVKFP
jgi:hypothetical protein